MDAFLVFCTWVELQGIKIIVLDPWDAWLGKTSSIAIESDIGIYVNTLIPWNLQKNWCSACTESVHLYKYNQLPLRGHTRELEKVPVSRTVCLQQLAFPLRNGDVTNLIPTVLLLCQLKLIFCWFATSRKFCLPRVIIYPWGFAYERSQTKENSHFQFLKCQRLSTRNRKAKKGLRKVSVSRNIRLREWPITGSWLFTLFSMEI